MACEPDSADRHPGPRRRARLPATGPKGGFRMPGWRIEPPTRALGQASCERSGVEATTAVVRNPFIRSELARVALWMAGMLVSFSTTTISVRTLARSFDAFEIMTLRSTGGVVILLALAAARPRLWADVRVSAMMLHSLRSGFHFVSQIAWVQAITLLPLATLVALEFTTPAWVAVFAVVLLRERMTTSRLGSIVLSFIGIVVILRPGIEVIGPGPLFVLGAAITFALTSIATKKLTMSETTFAILFWMNVMQLAMNVALSNPSFIFALEPSMIIPVTGLAVAGLSVHWCLTNALRCGDAITVAPLDFLRVPLMAGIGAYFYDERLDALVFAGAGLIILGILWNVRAEARRQSTDVAAF
jgi:drug/metabolite transporter (DMT)-like permease